MSPRTGRPTDAPKENQMRIRMSDEDLQKLEYCCKVLGLTRAEVIRTGINWTFEKTKRSPVFYNRNNVFNRRKNNMTLEERFEEWIAPIEEEYKEQQWQEWQEHADEEFESWADTQREEAKAEVEEKGEEWTEWDEDRFEAWILKEKERDEEDQHEKFEDWYGEHRDDWLTDMHEKWIDMNAE